MTRRRETHQAMGDNGGRRQYSRGFSRAPKVVVGFGWAVHLADWRRNLYCWRTTDSSQLAGGLCRPSAEEEEEEEEGFKEHNEPKTRMGENKDFGAVLFFSFFPFLWLKGKKRRSLFTVEWGRMEESREILGLIVESS